MTIKKRTVSFKILAVIFILIAWMADHSSPVLAQGTWVPLINQAPGGVGVMLLLSDGTVMCANYSGSSAAWYRLTPDQYGSYVNGTWSTLNSANYPRLFFASDVLQNGKVFVAGGEYGAGDTNAEIYDPVANHWTPINPPTSLFNPANGNQFIDMISTVIPNGSVLMAPVYPANYGGTLLYNPKTGIWSNGPVLTNGVYNQDEAGWAKLADGSILTIDPNANTSERFIPSLNRWIPDAKVPVFVWNTNANGYEIGPALTLPNGNALWVAGTGSNAVYIPSGTTNPGTWLAAPVTPDNLQTADASGAVMSNGKELYMAASDCFNGGCNGPWSFFQYDYTVLPVGAISSVPTVASGLTTGLVIPYMLDLPDGNVLLSSSVNQLYEFQPSGSPLASAQPTITSITPNADGSFHLVGTGLNGITEGANEGDDGQMDSDYPIVRLTNTGSGLVYYARTYNWSSTQIHTGSTPESTEFTLPTSVPPGTYSLVVVANGVASSPVTFYGPVWVDFNTSVHPGNGTYATPYYTLALGISAVPTGGTIFVKPGSSMETPTITKAMSIIAVGGAATVGQ